MASTLRQLRKDLDKAMGRSNNRAKLDASVRCRFCLQLKTAANHSHLLPSFLLLFPPLMYSLPPTPLLSPLPLFPHYRQLSLHAKSEMKRRVPCAMWDAECDNYLLSVVFYYTILIFNSSQILPLSAHAVEARAGTNDPAANP